AGRGGLPSGLAEVDPDEERDARHPVGDDDLLGVEDMNASDRASEESGLGAAGKSAKGSRKPREPHYRSPIDYQEILRSTGATISPEDAIVRYYREAALPWLVPFPEHETAHSTDPIPEGLDIWDAGAPLEEIDWLESVVTSPVVVPGVTTM